MNEKFLKKHLNLKASGQKDELGIIVFKPGYKNKIVLEFKEHCKSEDLKILEEKEVHLNKDMVIALYQNIFTYSKEDLKYGVDWKFEVIKYLTSNKCLALVLEGRGVINKLMQYKRDIRARYGKIKHPERLFSKKEFKEKVIKNIVHVSDETDVQNTIWLLFS